MYLQYLYKYLQFLNNHDEVKLDEISRTFNSVVKDQLSHIISSNERFISITHSKGGPAIRNWLHKRLSGKNVVTKLRYPSGNRTAVKRG